MTLSPFTVCMSDSKREGAVPNARPRQPCNGQGRHQPGWRSILQSHLIRHVNDQGGGDAPCPIVFGELQLGVRRRRKEEGEEEESQVADEEEKEERELGKGSQREEERGSSINSTSGTFCHSRNIIDSF